MKRDWLRMTGKKVAYGAIFTSIAAMIELAAAFSGEVLVMVTVFTTLPIYLTCRMDKAAGLLSYLSILLMLLIFSPHQSIFFAFLNGLLGLALGITGNIFNKNILSIIISAFALACGILIIIFVFGIPIFDMALPEDTWVKVLAVLLFSIAYTTIYQFFVRFVFKRCKGLYC